MIIHDATNEEPPRRSVLVWDESEGGYWKFASYNAVASACKGGALPSSDCWATWGDEYSEGTRNYRWWIDIQALRPPETS